MNMEKLTEFLTFLKVKLKEASENEQKRLVAELFINAGLENRIFERLLLKSLRKNTNVLCYSEFAKVCSDTN